MRNSAVALVLLGFSVAGCSESDPVESPTDAADSAIGEVGSETSTDATLPSDGDAATDEGVDTLDTATDDAEVATDATDGATETGDSGAEIGDADDAGDAADATEASDAADTADAADAADTAVDDALEAGLADAADAASAAGELWVVRVGDGATALDGTSAPVSIDRLQLPSGSIVGSITLPTAAAGTEQAFTLPGSGGESGLLARSSDRRFVTLAGYATPPGTADVTSTLTTAVPRVIARIDGSGVVSTATTTIEYDSSAIRSAVTDTGARFWVGGVGGIYFLGGFGGPTAATFVSTGATNVRYATIIDGALYASGNSPLLFNFATPLPTSASTPTALPGGPTAGSLSGMIGFSRSGTETNLLYVCDYRMKTSGGGIQRWTKSAGTWSLSATIPVSATRGCRSVTGTFEGGQAKLYAVTDLPVAELVAVTDDPSSSTLGTPTTLLTATATKVIRGIALRPVP